MQAYGGYDYDDREVALAKELHKQARQGRRGSVDRNAWMTELPHARELIREQRYARVNVDLKPALDYDKLIAQAKEHVPADVIVDMCRHETVKQPTFWLFRYGAPRPLNKSGRTQIGSVAFEPETSPPWRATRMHRGMPVGQLKFVSMDQALRYAATGNDPRTMWE